VKGGYTIIGALLHIGCRHNPECYQCCALAAVTILIYAKVAAATLHLQHLQGK
jgi:hypothetical protein